MEFKTFKQKINAFLKQHTELVVDALPRNIPVPIPEITFNKEQPEETRSSVFYIHQNNLYYRDADSNDTLISSDEKKITSINKHIKNHALSGLELVDYIKTKTGYDAFEIKPVGLKKELETKYAEGFPKALLNIARIFKAAADKVTMTGYKGFLFELQSHEVALRENMGYLDFEGQAQLLILDEKSKQMAENFRTFLTEMTSSDREKDPDKQMKATIEQFSTDKAERFFDFNDLIIKIGLGIADYDDRCRTELKSSVSTDSTTEESPQVSSAEEDDEEPKSFDALLKELKALDFELEYTKDDLTSITDLKAQLTADTTPTDDKNLPLFKSVKTLNQNNRLFSYGSTTISSELDKYLHAKESYGKSAPLGITDAKTRHAATLTESKNKMLASIDEIEKKAHESAELKTQIRNTVSREFTAAIDAYESYTKVPYLDPTELGVRYQNVESEKSRSETAYPELKNELEINTQTERFNAMATQHATTLKESNAASNYYFRPDESQKNTFAHYLKTSGKSERKEYIDTLKTLHTAWKKNPNDLDAYQALIKKIDEGLHRYRPILSKESKICNMLKPLRGFVVAERDEKLQDSLSSYFKENGVFASYLDSVKTRHAGMYFSNEAKATIQLQKRTEFKKELEKLFNSWFENKADSSKYNDLKNKIDEGIQKYKPVVSSESKLCNILKQMAHDVDTAYKAPKSDEDYKYTIV